MAGWSPLMRSVVVGVAAVQLSTLLAALDSSFPTRLQLLQLEYDITGAGDLFVGSTSGVGAANCGRHLVPGQSFLINPNEQGVILTSDFFLKAGAAAQQLNVVALPAGM